MQIQISVFVWYKTYYHQQFSREYLNHCMVWLNNCHLSAKQQSITQSLTQNVNKYITLLGEKENSNCLKRFYCKYFLYTQKNANRITAVM